MKTIIAIALIFLCASNTWAQDFDEVITVENGYENDSLRNCIKSFVAAYHITLQH